MKNVIIIFCIVITTITNAQVSFIKQEKPGNEQPTVIAPYNWRFITVDDVIKHTQVHFYVYDNTMYWVVVLPRCIESLSEESYPEESNFPIKFYLKKGEVILKTVDYGDINPHKCKITWSLPIVDDRGDYEAFFVIGIDSDGREYILYTD